jgi:hypothetical protein
MDASRTIIETDGVTLELNSSEEVRVKDGGISTVKIANAAVTAAKRAAITSNESSSCGAFSTTNTSFVSVTNLSAAITTSGRPVLMFLKPDGSGSGATFRNDSDQGAELRFLRSGTEISRVAIGSFGYQSATCLYHMETSLGAGSYTYTVEVRSVTGANTQVNYFKLFVYEL